MSTETSLGVTSSDEIVDEEQEFVGDISAAGPHLFSSITVGEHDGFLIDDLGWGNSIREKLGIESIIALANKGNAQEFFEWVKHKEGVPLADWEPVKLTLFQGWRQYEMLGSTPPCCFRSWLSSDKRFDEVAIRPVEVFALRHYAWRLLDQARIREFYIAMQRSHLEMRWMRANPGRELTPEDVEGDAGFVVLGRPRGTLRKIRLTWPKADIFKVIEMAEEFKKKRVADLVISEVRGVGYQFNSRTRSAWIKIAQLDKHWGGRTYLMEMAQRVGM